MSSLIIHEVKVWPFFTFSWCIFATFYKKWSYECFYAILVFLVYYHLNGKFISFGRHFWLLEGFSRCKISKLGLSWIVVYQFDATLPSVDWKKLKTNFWKFLQKCWDQLKNSFLSIFMHFCKIKLSFLTEISQLCKM